MPLQACKAEQTSRRGFDVVSHRKREDYLLRTIGRRDRMCAVPGWCMASCMQDETMLTIEPIAKLPRDACWLLYENNKEPRHWSQKRTFC